MPDQTLVQWLQSLPGILDVQPITLVVGKERFQAARYTQRLQYTQGMDCVARGDRKAGETYDQTAIYVIGNLPKGHKNGSERKDGTSYIVGADRWYLACYYQQNQITAQQPFGRNFILMLHSADYVSYAAHPAKPAELIPA